MGHAHHYADAPAESYSDDILRSMVQSAPVAIAVASQSGEIVLVNNKLADMFGYESAELVGKPIEILMPERYRAGHGALRDEYTGNPRQRPMGSGLDLSGRRRDGSEFPIEVGLSHYRTSNRLWIMATVADITRRKQNEEFLERRVQERTRELERRRQVSDTLRDILAILNSDRPLPDILQHIVVQASLLLQADASAIYQMQETPETQSPLMIQASCGLSSEQLSNPLNLTLPAAVKQVVENGELVTVSDPGEVSSAYCAQLAVPLRIKDEIYGGLMLYYLEPRKFSDEEIELAVMFGDQAVLAIENAGLRARAERTAVAAERNRIARDLHDSVTQTLFSATLIAEVLPKLVERNGKEGMRRLEELRQLTRGALAEMRTLLLELRPATLIEVNVEELLRQLTEAARGRARIPIELQTEVTAPMPPDVKVAFYYIAQEALNNVAKHARAGSTHVHLASHPQGAELSVYDDGQGFDVAQVTPEHLGLAIMRERSEAIGGKLTVDSTPGEGTEITIRWTNPEMAGSV